MSNSLPVDVVAFDTAWRTRSPESLPFGHLLRASASDRWVRFHSLPRSKRYAENEAEYDELLRRHFTLLSELSSSSLASLDDLRVVTTAWSESPQRVARHSDLVAASPGGTYWQSVPYDLSDPDHPTWAHLYLGSATLDDLRSLLLLVADDGTGNVIICPPSVDWHYHPYDGGADVIAPDLTTRDLLRSRHPGWLPDNPQGL